MGALINILTPNTSNEAEIVNINKWLPIQEWAVKKESEYASKSGPVITRVDKAECERLFTSLINRKGGEKCHI